MRQDFLTTETFKYGRDIGFVEMVDGIRAEFVGVVPLENEIRVSAGAIMLLEESFENGVSTPLLASVHIVLEEGSRLEYIVPSVDREAMSLVRRVFEVGPGACLVVRDGTTGSPFTQSFTTVTLVGRDASAECFSGFRADGAERLDVCAHIVHAAPSTRSRIVTRAAADGTAKIVSRDIIVIGKGMVGCVAQQESKVLLLSRTASCQTVPQLEIATDEVVAKHSASISRIDDAHLFGLMSRGISCEEATALILDGFFAGVRADLVIA